MGNDNQLVEKVVDKIKELKFKIINIDDVSELIKSIIGDSFTSEIGIAVKARLKEHDSISFFREGEYISEHKFHHCSGNWLAIKGIYESPVEAKSKMGWYAWQLTEDIDWDSLD